MSHILIVGGTGMLKDVPLYFAYHAMTASVIARNEKRFDELIFSKGEAGFINPITVDYTNDKLLKKKLLNAIDSFGAIDTAVSWIHSTAPKAPYTVAEILNNQNIKSKYFHILGCEFANPYKKNLDIKKNFEKYENIVYRKIILGFVIEDSRSRWLTNTEISNGVIDAINKDADTFIIGSVEPWKKRP